MQADLLNCKGIKVWECYWRQWKIGAKIWGKNMSNLLQFDQPLFRSCTLAYLCFDIVQKEVFLYSTPLRFIKKACHKLALVTVELNVFSVELRKLFCVQMVAL